MITMKKRLIAIICCIALLVTSIYVSQPQSAEAADETTSGTLTINTDTFNSVLGWNDDGSFNIPWCTATFNDGSDFDSTIDFLNDEFVENYIEFGGGMTKADFMNGLVSIYYFHNLDCILQINWRDRTETFTSGWSFTIAQGTPIAYQLSDGTTSYLALDKEYVFTFAEGNTDYRNLITVKGYKTTTFSLDTGIFGTGSAETGADKVIYFADSNVTGYDAKYHYMHNDSEYASYINFNGVAFEDLAGTGLQLRYGLDNGAFIQIENWGTFAGPNGMKSGDQFVFEKGLPIYYVANGVECKATLDATYIYECIGPNNNSDGAIANYQVFLGCKVDDVKTEFGFTTLESTYGTFPQERGYTEWAVNLFMDTTISDGSCGDILAKPYSREFVEWKGITYDEAKSLNILMSLHGSEPCIQLGFTGNLEDSDLPVGTQIILKKGFPITWQSGEMIQCAALNDSYIITLEGKTAGDSGNYQWSVRLLGTFGLNGQVGDVFTEDGAISQNIFLDTLDFSDITIESDYAGDFNATAMANKYFYANRDGKTVDLTTEGWYFRYYYFTTDASVRMLRYYCPGDYSNFTEGDYIIWREGLPFTYPTENGMKVATLDKDYGFTWDGSKFVYDASLVYTEPAEQTYTTEITSMSISGIKLSDNYALNIVATNDPDLSSVDYQEVPLLSNDATASYINICGIDAATLVSSYGVQVTFIPTANVFQLILGTDYQWLPVGAEITFTEGMPIPVIVNGETVTVTLQNTMTYRVDSITEEAPYVTMNAYAESQEFYLKPTECDGIQENVPVNLGVYDANGESNILDDCISGGAYDNSKVSYTTMAKYIDFCGFTASELEKYGVYVRLAAGDTNELMQIYPGTMPSDMIVGETVTLKKGLPITYTTTEGYKKTITLAKDYTFVVGEGVTVGDETYVCRWLYTETEPSIWRMKSGELNQVSGTETGDEGYFNNLALGSSPLLDNVTSLEYTFTSEQMKKYIDFAGLDASEYNITAIAIITETDQVVQLRWGNATTKVEEGQTVTFKAGLPIVINGTVVYKLETDIVYTVEKSASGSNGFCLSNIVEITNTQPGDADGDYILNVNDVNLIREALAELVIDNVKTQDVIDDDVLDSRDLVRAKKKFDIEENEDNGTETYTLLAEKEVGFQTMGASSNDTKAGATSITYELNADLGTKTYLRLTYKTGTDLRGEFIYTVNGGDEVTEEFFLEADKPQFKQFLDVYRSNGLNGKVSDVNIVLKKIILYNLSTKDTTNVRLYKIEAAERSLVTDDMIWAASDKVKIGVDLNMGGALAWMECLQYTIYEYTDYTGLANGNESIIGTKAQCENCDGDIKQYENVNLININDLGRQVQQSYYSVPEEQVNWDGDTFAYRTYGDDTEWPYNPVQAGDSSNNQSQIVDYREVDTDNDGQSDVIYVKTRAMDWASSNVTTDSYMESWYKVKDKLVYVDNCFIDWSGYDFSTVDKTQELPAVYLGQGLNTLVSDEDGDTQKNTDLGSWTESDAYKNSTTTTDWYAFVNSEGDDAFGVGIYIPGVEQTIAGRARDSRSIWWYDSNHNADEAPILKLGYSYLNDLYQDNECHNCFVGNTSYIAPVRSGWMKGYEDYSFTYVLTADTLNNISGSFATLQESNAVDNSTLQEWEINPNE